MKADVLYYVLLFTISIFAKLMTTLFIENIYHCLVFYFVEDFLIIFFAYKKFILR